MNCNRIKYANSAYLVLDSMATLTTLYNNYEQFSRISIRKMSSRNDLNKQLVVLTVFKYLR